MWSAFELLMLVLRFLMEWCTFQLLVCVNTNENSWTKHVFRFSVDLNEWTVDGIYTLSMNCVILTLVTCDATCMISLSPVVVVAVVRVCMTVKAAAVASPSYRTTLQRATAMCHETPLAIKRKLFLDNAIIYYAQLYFNTHRRGLLGRKVSLNHMLTWSKVLLAGCRVINKDCSSNSVRLCARRCAAMVKTWFQCYQLWHSFCCLCNKGENPHLICRLCWNCIFFSIS